MLLSKYIAILQDKLAENGDIEVACVVDSLGTGAVEIELLSKEYISVKENDEISATRAHTDKVLVVGG